MTAKMELIALSDIPLVQPGDDLATLLIAAIERAGITMANQDILVVAQKIVSKAEGRIIDAGALTPSPRALELAQVTGKSPGLVQAILNESKDILRAKPGLIVAEHRLGFVMANGGIDKSNIEAEGSEPVLLLPENPDASAAVLRKALSGRFAAEIGVVISDSIGRAWRLGTVGHALGAAGVPPLIDWRGQKDLSGRLLEITMTGFADAVAAAAVLLMGEGAEACPAVVVKGLRWSAPEAPASTLIRPKPEDLFR